MVLGIEIHPPALPCCRSPQMRINLLDIYVSSYAPPLFALLRAREHLRSQREFRDACERSSAISFAAVGQACPSTDTGLGQLPEVEHEIQRIRDNTNMPADAKFTGASPLIERAVQAFRDHRWGPRYLSRCATRRKAI